ncbi:MAG: hypothetical protein HFG02_04140, partial [Oscillibacter sp.]|nr:hypothetical protein [Oscillibacter sp.]
YILETVLTSPMPSLTGFDRKGESLYAEESRTETQLECIQEIQNGILEYFQTYLKLYPVEPENRKLGECLLTLVHHLAAAAGEFSGLMVEDTFFNRSTALSDLL